MARSTHTGDTVVIRWGCPSWAPISDELAEQFRLANELRNRLVASERRWDEVREALWLTIPGVAAAERALDDCRLRLAAVVEEAKADRVSARTTRPDPVAAPELTAARRAVADAKTARNRVRKTHRARHKEIAAPWLDAYRAVTDNGKGNTALYAEHVQTRGLGWGTYNAIVDRHRRSAQLVISARTRGEPAEHRFRRFDGSGTVHVQVQRDKHGARRSGVWELAPARPRHEWTGRPARHSTTTARGGRQPATLCLTVRARHQRGVLTVELPVICHRPLPPGADVSDVEVTCRMVAGQPRLSVQLTCLIPVPAPVVAGSVVAVKLHWDHRGDGWLRAARIATSGTRLPPAPPDVAPLLRIDSDGRAADLHYHPEWARLLDRDAGIRSIRDRDLDVLRDRILTSPAIEVIAGIAGGRVDRWRAPRRFIRLGQAITGWLETHPGERAAGELGDVRDAIETWRHRDRHLWAFEAHERDQVIARRRDAWRKVAAWLCAGARQVVVEDVDHAGLRRVAPVGVEDTEQSRHGRAQAVRVAPYELRQAVENAARRRGIEIVTARQERTAA
jgi:hypothetical protein